MRRRDLILRACLGACLGAGLALAGTGAALAAGTAAPKDGPGPNLVLTIGGQAQGQVVIDLRPDLAPKAAERLETLARKGAYDGVVFHRVIDGFMAQTGDVQFGKKGGDQLSMAGMGGSDLPNLPAEFSKTHFARGVVGMARAADPNSANSQFFIMFDDAGHLDGQYTVVGQVISGMDVVDAIKKGDSRRNGMVEDPDYIVKAEVTK